MIMDGTAQSISQSVTEHQLCGSFLIYEKQRGRQSLEAGAKKGKSTILLLPAAPPMLQLGVYPSLWWSFIIIIRIIIIKQE